MKVGLYILTLDFLASYFQNKISNSDKKMFDLGKEAGSWSGSSPVGWGWGNRRDGKDNFNEGNLHKGDVLREKHWDCGCA